MDLIIISGSEFYRSDSAISYLPVVNFTGKIIYLVI